MNLAEGNTYEARIYIANDANTDLQINATNVKVAVNMPNSKTTFGYQFEVNAFIPSDNTHPTKIWDNIVLKSKYKFHTQIISQTYYNSFKTTKNNGFPLPNTLFQQDGTSVGYKTMDGNIPGGNETAGLVIIIFKSEWEHPTLVWLDTHILSKIFAGLVTPDKITDGTYCEPNRYCDYNLGRFMIIKKIVFKDRYFIVQLIISSLLLAITSLVMFYLYIDYRIISVILVSLIFSSIHAIRLTVQTIKLQKSSSWIDKANIYPIVSSSYFITLLVLSINAPGIANSFGQILLGFMTIEQIKTLWNISKTLLQLDTVYYSY